MGHLSFYNKNQIRAKLLLVLFFEGGQGHSDNAMVLNQKTYCMHVMRR